MRFVVFSNLYIAIGATLLARSSYVLLGQQPRWGALAGLVFCSTLVVYNLDRLVSASREDTVEGSKRHLWIQRHKTGLWCLVGAAVAGAIASALFLSTEVWMALAPLGVLSLAYSLPVLLGREGGFRLKDVPGLKIFVIASVWAGATALLPAVDAGMEILDLDVALVAVERFLFIFAITLPFDVRDLERDASAGIETIPMLVGARQTRHLATGLALLFGTVCLWHYGVALEGFGIPTATFAVVVALILVFSDRQRPEMYYVGLLDGTMLLHWLAVAGWQLLVPAG
mgnify:CR=1 FL=1